MKHGCSISLPKTALAIVISLVFLLPFFFLLGAALRTPADFAANPGGIPRAFTIISFGHSANY